MVARVDRLSPLWFNQYIGQEKGRPMENFIPTAMFIINLILLTSAVVIINTRIEG